MKRAKCFVFVTAYFVVFMSFATFDTLLPLCLSRFMSTAAVCPLIFFALFTIIAKKFRRIVYLLIFGRSSINKFINIHCIQLNIWAKRSRFVYMYIFGMSIGAAPLTNQISDSERKIYAPKWKKQ